MRPNKLIMSAFGPYAEKTVVSLDKLGENGIYLITGDTGAGKTTIFDAITYALFGEASGDNRDASMFRSKYANTEMPTEVELYFSYAGKEYYIKRNPEYERPKSRGEGVTLEKASAELHCPDGRIITKLKDVNSKITEILGIDRSQFTQIAMIAQGDFLKLLLASTEDRKKIFQKLFKTQGYYLIQEKLKAELGKLNHEYDAIKSSIEQYINGIVCDEGNPCFAEVCNAKNGDLATEEILELLKKLISDDRSSEKTNAEEKEKLQKELDDIKKRITKSEEILAARTELEKNEFDLRAESEKEAELKEKLNAVKENLPKVKGLTEKSAEIKASLPDYDELAEKQNVFNGNKAFIDNSAEKIRKAEAEIEIITDEITKLNTDGKSLEKAGEEKLCLEKDREKQENEKVKLEKLDRDIDDAKALVVKADEAYMEYKTKYNEAELLEADIKEKTRIYLEAQAGILAETLKVGEPCPVCGATMHPKAATKPLDVPTREELDNLQDKLNEANNALNNARVEAGKLKGFAEEKEENAKENIKLLFGNVTFDEAKSVIAERIEDIACLLHKIKRSISEALEKIEYKEKIDEILPQRISALEATKVKLAEIKDEVRAKTIENASIEKRIAELKSKLLFETKTDAENQITDLSKEIESIERTYDKALKEVNANKEKLISLKSAKEEILKHIGEDTDIDLKKEKEKKELLEEEQLKLDLNSKEIHSRINSNKSSLSNILKKLNEIKTVEENWTWVKALSNTANGNISGKEKIMLETYIQMNYFDRIINRANTRFLVMSGGQYELKRRKSAENNRSQSGLELDVIDHYNGTERSVKTLSGGESFKASLSLALGLSDEIQSSAGGIKLDTMFVDEGFGSLDDESLAQAIRALSSLAEGNRLVGIISHVSELRDKIDKQIVVKKEKSGGSSVAIFV